LPEIEGTESDQTLVAETLAGNRESFGVLMRRHQRGLYRLIRGVVRNADDADDLTQEAFYRAFRYLDRFDRERSFRPWLYKIGVNLSFHHLRRSRGEQWLRLDDEDPETGLSPMDRLVAPEGEAAIRRPLEMRRLEEAMEALPPLHRSVLVLRAVHGLHYEEIAEVLGIPQGTVMSRLSRARQVLRGILAGVSVRREPGRRP
jgi:RNA polymerase sigma-70 factor, ECF subfamily